MEPIKILYIEDNPGNRLLVKRVLEAEGYAVLEAGDDVEALELLEHETPALILMDIHLGGVDGYMLTAQLRQRDDLQAVPIVALTAFALEGDRERALQAGCAGYIAKPIDVDALPAQVETFLRKRAKKIQ